MHHRWEVINQNVEMSDINLHHSNEGDNFITVLIYITFIKIILTVLLLRLVLREDH